MTRQEFEEIYGALESRLYNFALRWVFDPGQAEDLVHEAFVRLWKRREELRVDTVKGLLYVCVRNLALNELRRRRIREALPALGWLMGSAPETAAPESMAMRELRAVIEALPLSLREVLLMCEFSDMGHAEIARALGIAEGTVASRRNRALRILEEKMVL